MRRGICGLAVAGLIGLWPGIALAGPMFSAAERAALGAEIRALLRAEPEIVDRAINPPSAFQEAVSADIERLARLAPELFGATADGFGHVEATLQIALFVQEDCADCAQALEDLRALQERYDLRVSLHRLDDDSAGAALAKTLDLREAPSYVLPEMMIQGHMPAVVLERYLAR